MAYGLKFKIFIKNTYIKKYWTKGSIKAKQSNINCH